MLSNNRSNGYNRKKIERKKLEKTAEQTPHCGWEQSGVYYDNNKKRYVRWSRSDKSKMPKSVKKFANKKVRKTIVPLKGNGYKKVYDVVDELY